jgi:hypothetical protein
MTWGGIGTFLWGSAVVLIDAAIGPLYRHIHRRSKR